MKATQLVLLLLLPIFALAQKPGPICKCPETMYVPAGTKPAKVFHFSNNRSIALYGYKDTGIIKGKTLYSEFVLAECGTKNTIDFWGAVVICDVTFGRDTLYVKILYDLPVGEDMKPKYMPWTIEHIFFSGGKSVRDLTINPAIPKYTAAQISKVLDLYRHTQNTNGEAIIDLADKLLISVMSGSKNAKYLLVNFPKKFTTLDGAPAEEYDTIMGMLNLWEKQPRGSKSATRDVD